MSKNVITFFIRAYNDLDCRLPLILFLSKKKKIKVNVFFYPTNNSFFNYNNHEKISLIKNNNKINLFSFRNFIINSNFIKFYFNTSNKVKFFLNQITSLDRNKFFIKFFNFFDRIFLKIVKYDEKKIDEVLKNNIFIFDDIILNKLRSKFILFLENRKIHKKIYAVQTGQDTYLNLKRIIGNKNKKNNELNVNYFFVPSTNDKNIFKKQSKNKLFILGNTRFDKKWVYYLNKKAKILDINNCKKHKIVFMLSKLEYGVKLKSLIKTLEYLEKMEDVTVILKPHTRGMALKNIFNENNFSNVINGEKFDSSSLIKWSDQVLFTGSSIIFQAMILKKKCIFLKNCLNVKSIFDKTNSVFTVKKLNELPKIIFFDKIKKNSIDSFVKKEVYGGYNSEFMNNTLYKLINEKK